MQDAQSGQARSRTVSIAFLQRGMYCATALLLICFALVPGTAEAPLVWRSGVCRWSTSTCPWQAMAADAGAAGLERFRAQVQMCLLLRRQRGRACPCQSHELRTPALQGLKQAHRTRSSAQEIHFLAQGCQSRKPARCDWRLC